MNNLTPSNAARRIACPGSRALELAYPKRDSEVSEHAQEGIDAHSIAMNVLRYNSTFDGIDSKLFEMYENAWFFKNTIQTYLSKDININNIESEIDLSMIHKGMTGRPDYCDIYENTLYIFDYKYGFKNVEAYENWQLIEYAFGILSNTNQFITHVHFVVVQPRISNQVKEWYLSTNALTPYFDIMGEKEKLSLEENAPCIPNPECTYCSARFNCPALQAFCLPLIDYTRGNITRDLSREALASELIFLREARDLLNARITGLEEEAIHLIKSGKRVPSFRLEESRASLDWSKSVEEIVALGELLDIDLKKPQSVITPKQAIKAGLDENLVKSYAVYKSGNLKLVSDVGLARKVFNVIDETVNNK